MAILAWVMMGLALWHFTIFLPDKFIGGIVGALVGSVAGAVIFGLAVHGFSMPSRDDTDIITALVSIPGSILGVAAVYFEGARREQAEEPAPA